MSLAPDEFPPERLERRLDFLLGRAETHLKDLRKTEGPAQDMLPRACAATLYRDAACVALLLERTREARIFLQLSGREFLSLGLPVGASLIALAGQRDAGGILDAHGDVLEGTRQQWKPSDARERRDFHRPMIDQARSEPRQLLAMMQADWLWDDRQRERVTYRDDEPLRMALGRNGGHPAGVTGLSIDSYSVVAEWFAERYVIPEQMPDRVAALMSAMMATRAEQLHAARKDSFHWRMLARPAELVDLDATILMYLASNEDGSPKANLENFMDRRRVGTPLLDAPVRVAGALRRDQYLERRSSLS